MARSHALLIGACIAALGSEVTAQTIPQLPSATTPLSGSELVAIYQSGATKKASVGNISSLGVTSFSAGSTGLSPSSATIGAVTLSGTLGISNGGTSQTTASAAFNSLSPITSMGDLIVGNGSNSAARLPIGSTNQVLSVGGGTASWVNLSSVGVSSFSGGTTGLTPSTPSAGAISLGGTLATGNGGTGLITFTSANKAIYSTSSSALTAGTLPIAAGGTADTGSAWTTYTPSVSCGTGTLTSFSASGRYKTLGKTLFLEINVSITTNGTCAIQLMITLPNSLVSAADYILSGRDISISGSSFVGSIIGSGSVFVTKYDNSYGLSSGSTLVLSGIVETS